MGLVLRDRPTLAPQPGPQTEFLTCTADVAFYGGAAGGGKTYALLMEPLYDKHNPKFGAVIFRRTTRMVRNEGGLWDTATDMYGAQMGARPRLDELSYTFPSGAKVTFAHLEHEKNKLDWQGSQIALICFDELTHFTWGQFSYLMSRNRSTSGAKSRIRGTLNPDPDHWTRQWVDWWIGEDGFAIPERSGVIRWFVMREDAPVWADSREELVERFPGSLPKSFTLISSKLSDNRILELGDPSYRATLEALPYVERMRLLGDPEKGGNWDVKPSAGDYFQRGWFEIVPAIPSGRWIWVRAWDLAATSKAAKGKEEPDWSVGLKLGKNLRTGRYLIAHVDRFRASPGAVQERALRLAVQDGVGCRVRLPQDPGQAGKAQVENWAKALAGYILRSKPVSGDKATRAAPVSAAAERGIIDILEGPWVEPLLKELERFTGQGDPEKDDQVDALGDAFDELTHGGSLDYGALTAR